MAVELAYYANSNSLKAFQKAFKKIYLDPNCLGLVLRLRVRGQGLTIGELSSPVLKPIVPKPALAQPQLSPNRFKSQLVQRGLGMTLKS